MSELSEAISEMRNMRESYDQIGAAAESYNTGKTELAQNITAKGVQASATETLPELAEKVAAISQETYEIDGGEMYAKQLFGSLETPNYWNLYEIMAQLLSDGRLVNYGGILLAEYYKGYDSLALSGAGSGGAYVVSDKDSDGNFTMYTNDTTHIWATEFDGKGNRWVAYCFAHAGHDFDITDTNTSPRTIHIGRNVGTVKLFATSRTSQVIVTDGNKLANLNTNTRSMAWQQQIVLRNIDNIANYLFYGTAADYVGSEKIYVEADNITGYLFYATGHVFLNNLSSLVIKTKKITNSIFNYTATPNLHVLAIDGVETGTISIAPYNTSNLSGLTNLIITNCDCSGIYSAASTLPTSSLKVYVGYKTNTGTFAFSHQGTHTTWAVVQDLQIQEGWCKGLNASAMTALTEVNMYAHILQKLKQDEADCGDGVTITLGATNLAKLTSQESIDLLDLLTNTYGYTFA